MQQAIFAAGCFWGVQYYFDQVEGVTETIVGYIGGHTDDPSSNNVYSFKTGHAEAVLITFDPKIVDYPTLLKHFFRMHDPTQLNRQGPDVGDLYRTVIFYFTDLQKQQAEKAKDKAQKELKKPIVTEISPAVVFYPAEASQQKFTERTGIGMCHVPYEPIKKED